MVAEAKAKAQMIAARARSLAAGAKSTPPTPPPPSSSLSRRPPPPPSSSTGRTPPPPPPPSSASTSSAALSARLAAQKAKIMSATINRNSPSPQLVSPQPPPSRGLGMGLNTAIHPLLLSSDTGSLRGNNNNSNKSGGHQKGKAGSAAAAAAGAANPAFHSYNKYLNTPTEEVKPANNPYFDEKLKPAHESKRDAVRKRGLVFNPHGKFIEMANELKREAERVEQEKRAEEERLKNSHKIEGIETDAILSEKDFRPDQPPEVEWWDEGLLHPEDDGKKCYDSRINYEPISIYIQHPVPIPAPWEKYQPKETKVYLTKKETKRLRKNTRAERHKEKQDRIRLGLDPAPPPKVKLSNLMSVLTNEAIKDPTLVEMKVKKDIAQRAQQHVDMNQDRGLTAEQRHEKTLEKLRQDKEKHGIYSAAFKVRYLGDKKHKYKVNVVAQQKSLTGITIFNPKFNLVIVEGGYHAVKYYKNLMLNRIAWTDKALPRDQDVDMTDGAGADGETESATASASLDGKKEKVAEPEQVVDMSTNTCTMVWMGELKTNSFKRWSLRSTETEQEAKDILTRYGASHFWVEAHALND